MLKYSPETDCRKVPRDLCGPSGCVLQPGPEECFDKKETVISEVYIKDIHPKLYKKDAYYQKIYTLATLPTAEKLKGKNARAFLVCGSLMKLFIS